MVDGTRFDRPRDREKLERKGWSAAKIGRAIAGKRPAGARANLQQSFRAKVAEEVQLAGEIFVYGHAFQGNIATEEVPPTDERETRLLVLEDVPSAWPLERLACVRATAVLW
jgi:hypothetical protein